MHMVLCLCEHKVEEEEEAMQLKGHVAHFVATSAVPSACSQTSVALLLSVVLMSCSGGPDFLKNTCCLHRFCFGRAGK